MTEEKNPDVEEIKERLGEEIPVEEDSESFKAKREKADIIGEFQNLGRQLGDTIRSAWDSEERVEVEGEVREGLRTFANELDKAFQEIREGTAAKKAKEEAAEFRSKVTTGELGDKTKTGIAQGLSWLSEGLATLADHFSPVEKSSPEEEIE